MYDNQIIIGDFCKNVNWTGETAKYKAELRARTRLYE